MQTLSSPSRSTSPFFSDRSRKRFQEESSPHIPILKLDREGTIQTLTPAARRALEYTSNASIDSCFFAHVHKRNMRRVMRDLAHMVCRGKQQTHWLLRLRTGNERWRWYRTSVQNNLDQKEGYILIQLRPL